MEDKQIIELYEARDEAAIEQTRAKYGFYLSKIASNILKDPQDSEECVQDSYFKTWRAIPPAKPSCFRAFIARITRNSALDIYAARHSGKRGGGEYEAALDEIAESISDAGGVSPEQTLELGELSRLISAYLEGLNLETRRIFVLRYWYFFPVSEIAAKMSVGESKVKTSLSRTRASLKSFLAKEGYTI